MPPARKHKALAPIHDLQVDLDRPFALKVNYSNLDTSRYHREHTLPVYLNDLISLRARQPQQKGVYTTHGLNKANLTQNGEGFATAIKYGRRRAGDAVEWAGNSGVDYASNYAKDHIRGAAKRIRGDGFFRNLAGNAVRAVGNVVGDTIKGGAVKRKRKPRAKKTGGSAMTIMDKHRRFQSPGINPYVAMTMDGNGFFRNLAGNAVRTLGNVVGDTIKGNGIRAPGMRV